jgi:chemotaxis signal transduction protein
VDSLRAFARGLSAGEISVPAPVPADANPAASSADARSGGFSADARQTAFPDGHLAALAEAHAGSGDADESAGPPVAPFRERVEADEAVQVVVFEIGGELHACDVLLVEEVVTRQPIHRLPDTPARIVGVLRLRGELVPVLDVAPFLDLALDPSRQPAVLVVGTAEGRIGVAADAVLEVVTLPSGSYRPAPSAAAGDAYSAGVARVDGRLVSLVDLAEVLREQTTLSLGETP